VLEVDDLGPWPPAWAAVLVPVPVPVAGRGEEVGSRCPHQMNQGDCVLSPVEAPNNGARSVKAVGVTEGAERVPNEGSDVAVGTTLQAAVEVERVIVRFLGPISRGRAEKGRGFPGTGTCPPAAYRPVLVSSSRFEAHFNQCTSCMYVRARTMMYVSYTLEYLSIDTGR